MKFIIFHGAFGSSEGNWFPELRRNLTALSQTVIIPQFPQEDSTQLTQSGPNTLITKLTLKSWLSTFQKTVLPEIKPGEPLCFIGHSLGCVFILHLVEKFHLKLDSAIFVGPFMDCLPTEVWPYDRIIADFAKTTFDFDRLKKLIPDSYVLYSGNDPYVANHQSKLFAKMLDSSTIKLKKAGHMNAEVDLEKFSLVLDLCLTRLDLTFAQKYEFLNRKIGAFEYVSNNQEEGMITLEARSTFQAELYDFHDVKQVGFATQFTGFLDVYDPGYSPYMVHSRKAARRMKRFDRVILLEKIEDLNKPIWQDQIKLDLQSGIHIYLCLYDEVKAKIPEPDFGLWDNHHVIIGKFSWKTRKMKQVIIDSRSQSVKKAQEWQRYLQEHSFPIKRANQDIRAFITKHQT